MIPKGGNQRNRSKKCRLIIVWYLDTASICLHDSPNYEPSQGKTLGDVCNRPVKTSTPVSVT